MTSLSKITGKRIDPTHIILNSNNTKSSKYQNVYLGQIASITKGDCITSADIIEGKYPVIAGGQTSPYSHNTFNYSGNVITVSASGAYAGYIWYHSLPIFASDCCVIQSKNEKLFNTRFLYEVLKAQQYYIYQLQHGAGQPHVYASDLTKIWIPKAPIQKQKRIVDYIVDIKQQIKILRQSSAERIKVTKEIVELMIIGN